MSWCPPWTTRLLPTLADIYQDPKAPLAIPGIGKSMAGHIRDISTTAKLSDHEEFLKKFRPSMFELLKIQGPGPKTIIGWHAVVCPWWLDPGAL